MRRAHTHQPWGMRSSATTITIKSTLTPAWAGLKAQPDTGLDTDIGTYKHCPPPVLTASLI